MAKNFDLKQFLLHKGERVAIGVALAVMLFLIVMGAISGFSSASPSATANQIKEKADKIRANIHTLPAESSRDLAAVIATPCSVERVDVLPFATGTPNFIENNLEGSKRNLPKVLEPVEFDAQPALVQVMNHMFNDAGENRKVGVLVPTAGKKEAKDVDNMKKYLDRFKGQIDPRVQAQMMANFLQQQKLLQEMMKQNAAPGDAKAEWTLEFVDARKIPQGAKLASTVQPYRMVIVSASFPYKMQLDEFRHALGGLRNLNELYASRDMPRFARILVQRRVLDVHDKVVENWTALDLEKDILPVLAHAVSFAPIEPSEESIRPVAFEGLVMARPKLARGEYPKPNMANLPKLADALQKLQAAKNGNVAVMEARPQDRGIGSQEGINPFGVGGAAVEDQDKPTLPNPREGARDAKDKELVVPDHCLIRFCDVNVQPGRKYEYQMKLILENPSFGKPVSEVAYPEVAQKKEIGEITDWAPKEPKSVTVPGEGFYYATELDEKTRKEKLSRLAGDNKDVTFVQMHRWLEKVRLNPENPASTWPVGDWTVADIAVRRGEYISRQEQVKLPIWLPNRECFDFAVPIATAPAGLAVIGRKPVAGAKGIPVSFATEDLLVDWEGGKMSFKPSEKASREVTEDAAVEILLLAADGTLRVRNSRVDLNDPERKQRFDLWKKLIDETENKVKKAGGADDPSKAKPKP